MATMLRAIDIDLIRERTDARALDAAKVEALVESIVAVGLINPVRVRERGDHYELIAGNHRLAAHKNLGLADIAAFVVRDDDLKAELAMIDENLCRSELSPADRARQTFRRRELYEVINGKAKAKGAHAANESMGRDHDASAKLADAFSVETAKLTGASDRAVQRDAERGEKVIHEVLDLVRGTHLDTGLYLDKLKRLPPSDQVAMAKRDLASDRQLPRGARSIMASREQPKASLDYFPTPPWATRALFADALPRLGIAPEGMGLVVDPACGEGHMSAVLLEYCRQVKALDIADYGRDGRQPPGWHGVMDFLADDRPADWFITNPPFGDATLPFVLAALDRARAGVAMFVRQQWLEGIERYETLFRDRPPTLYAQFAERVNLCEGRWEPYGSTATAYCWLVWARDVAPQPPFWIPPGRRVAYFRPDDIERFTAHPVIGPPASAPAPSAPFRSTPESDEIIRAGYAAEVFDLQAIADRLGATRKQVRSRASQIGLGDRDRQREAVIASNVARAGAQ